MKYFLDTEFLEGPQKESFPISLFRKETPNTIDLISIGIVAEDGREYYAISKDFNLKEAWNRFQMEQVSGDQRNIFPEGKKVYWIRENVLKPIFYELSGKDIQFHDLSTSFTYKQMKYLIDKYGKTNKEIAFRVKTFCCIGTAYSTMDKSIASVMHFSSMNSEVKKTIEDKDLKFVFNELPEFYAYYADYDWVVFCWLFGNMIDLPKGFQKYCKDLKQMLDEKVSIFCESEIRSTSFDSALKRLKEKHESFPKQDPSKSHNAIEDARWNKNLHDFLLKI